MTKTGKMKATGLLKLHKHRMWQPWQAYHNLTYESKWKAEIDHCWNEYTIKWKGENLGQALEKTRFEFMNAFIKDKYEAESLEVKAEVEKHRISQQRHLDRVVGVDAHSQVIAAEYDRLLRGVRGASTGEVCSNI